jgi:hypothetical protein
MMPVPARDLDSLLSQEQRQLVLLYHFCRLQFPLIVLPLDRFIVHVRRMYDWARLHSKHPVASWSAFLEGLHPLDAFVSAACLERSEEAWQVLLFDARVGRQERRLVDALRARAVKLYPGNEERQNNAVDDFWGHLLVAETPGAVPILERYDGQRPLVPWLICIFHNWQISQLRSRDGKAIPLEDDDLLGERELPSDPTPQWHESFCEAARAWLSQVADQEDVLLLGLLWRYRLSQREVSRLLAVHEGTISRRLTQLSSRCLEFVEQRLRSEGWSGDDLSGFIHTEMATILLEEPRLSADHLGRMLKERGIKS